YVFIYIGALERIGGAVAGMLAEDGLFAFSVERLAGGGDFALQPSRRYAHSETYAWRVLAANRLAVLSLDRTVIRHDRRDPVEGLAIVAGFPTTASAGLSTQAPA
ncbi:hypothetical protein EN839_34200, partial [Mesorhizobium sp. M1C.F.Ca.ET.196.01.1.1]